jgi:hypothetical protein
MLPSAVNDTMRDMMAQIRDVGDGIRGGTYTMTAPVITGGSINNTPIGATTANTGAFSTLTNAALTSGRVTYAGTSGVLQDDADFTFNGTTVTMANDASISGRTVGKGGGAVAQNTAFGSSALSANTTGNYNVAVGVNALSANTTGDQNNAFGYALITNTTGSQNNAFGANALRLNTTGTNNCAFGDGALDKNTTASNNTAVGYQAGFSNTTGTQLVAIGHQAGYANTTGNANTLVGHGSGAAITTNSANTFVGTNAGLSTTGGLNTFVGGACGNTITTGTGNTIIGRYSGNADGLDIRTASNYAVISDGGGNRLITMADGQTLALDSAVPNSGTGITFPATQSASSDANTLDDYEEGTWTPVLTRETTAPTISYQFREGRYTKIGNMVTCWITIHSITVSSAGSGVNSITGLPFAVGNATYSGSGGFGYNDAFVNTVNSVVMNNNITKIFFGNGARRQSDDDGGWSNSGYLGLTFTYYV